MIGDTRVLAVIIGRAGSKGLPGKNAMLVAGRAMILHSIDHAQQSSLVDRVIVSTDGEKIARATREAGVEVIHRPAEHAHDTATVDAAVRHAVQAAADDADIIVILYANVPIRPAGLIDRALQMLDETGADSVQSYCDVGKYHPYWMVKIDREGRVAPNIPSTVYRRQNLPPLFIPDGGVIAVTRTSLFTVDPSQPHAFLGKDRRGIINTAGTVVDVDSAVDALVAEAILSGTRGASA